MRRLITFLAIFIIVTGVFAQNKKVAVFDISGTDNERFIKDVRNTYYWKVVDYKKFDAIDVDVVSQALKKNNYQQANDTSYKEATKLAKQMGAQLVLLSKVRKNHSTFIIHTELLDVEKSAVVAKGKGVYQNLFNLLDSGLV